MADQDLIDSLTTALKDSMGPMMMHLGDAIIGLARSAPQITGSLVMNATQNQMVSSLAASGVQKLMSSGIDWVTGTYDSALRTSDLFFGTVNSALNTKRTREYESQLGSKYLSSVASSVGKDTAAKLFQTIYGDNYKAGSGFEQLYGSMSAGVAKNALDALLPGFAAAERYRGTRDSRTEVKDTLYSFTSAYMRGTFGSATEQDLSTIVSGLRASGGPAATGHGLIDATKEITKSLDNIRDFLGRNVSADQLKQTLVQIAGSDLTRTGRATAESLTREMSYLNRRYGLGLDAMQAFAKQSQAELGAFGVNSVLAGQVGLQVAGYMAGHKSTNMFVSDSEQTGVFGGELQARILNGEAGQFGQAMAAAESFKVNGKARQLTDAQKQQLASARSLDEKIRLVSRWTGQSMEAVRSRFDSFNGSQTAAENTTLYTTYGSAAIEEEFVKQYDEFINRFISEQGGGLSATETQRFKQMTTREQENFIGERYGESGRRNFTQYRTIAFGKKRYEAVKSAYDNHNSARKQYERDAKAFKRHQTGVAGMLQYLYQNTSLTEAEAEQLKGLFDAHTKDGVVDIPGVLDAARKNKDLWKIADVRGAISVGLTGYAYRDAEMIKTAVQAQAEEKNKTAAATNTKGTTATAAGAGTGEYSGNLGTIINVLNNLHTELSALLNKYVEESNKAKPTTTTNKSEKP